MLCGLYVITDEKLGGGHLAIARAALQGGAKIIQLRDKSTSPRKLLAQAKEIRALTTQFGALFLVNDRLDLALLCEADGLHLGPDDWPLEDARRVLGAQKILGASCGTINEAQAAQNAGCDYIGVGAIFGTQTKLDAGAAIGLENLAQIAKATDLPVAAIGGVNGENIQSTIEAGAKMACVVSAIAGANDKIQATRELVARC